VHGYSNRTAGPYMGNTYSTYSKRAPKEPYSIFTGRAKRAQTTPEKMLRRAAAKKFQTFFLLSDRNKISICNARARPLEAHTLDNRAQAI
jgi:hypothetical protein